MNDNHHQEDHFFKGLFYGIALGVGMVWFSGTKEGKRFKNELMARGQSLLDSAESSLEEDLIEKVDSPKKKSK